AKAYAARHGWIVEDAYVYVDDGISGAEFANRPGFVRLMAALKPKAPFSVLIMSEVSRLGREQIETAYALQQLAVAGVRCFSYLEGRELVLESATDKFLLGAVTFAADLEREKARQRTYDAMMRKAKAGYALGPVGFGYDMVRVGDHTERRINDAEAAIVRQIFEWSAAGLGYRRIGKQLNEAKAPTPRPRGNRPAGWTPDTVEEVLKRPLYRGEVVWNRSRKRDGWGQEHKTPRPAADYITISVPDLRIVSDQQWHRAHQRLMTLKVKTIAASAGNQQAR